MVLGGFSVSGDSIFSPLESIELKEVEERLIKVRKEVKREKASKWLQKFVNSESELEHEAFLAFWLSREGEPRVELCKFEELLSFVDVPLLRRQPESLASSLKAKQCSMLQNMHKQSGNCMPDGITKLLFNTTLPTNNLKSQSPTFILLHQQRTESKNIPINQRAAIRRWFNRRPPAASIKNLILILFRVARASCILPVILHKKQEHIS
ncbi:uncharacterized protein LOC121049482 isoform X2 [Rosa chinensis]|uniref:uncharacterized protein LOC121049482 isoform X2 n=1 Tax=Rosa chinensis TaxID=74649 RepID=UPI001AD92F02|nr:uncharacterized protein LOC121049482 isoform X2 [Rosa chinensis]